MEELDGAVFWSYAREDDRSDSGHLVALAERLTGEYSLITGRELKLFVDRDIAWGEEWRQRIDDALVETTFFVPILTPRYFNRPECRKEATTFYSKAQAAGLGELLKPILYAPVAEFNHENPDQLIALISKYQHTDWTALRLQDPNSAIYRQAVHDLAQRLADVAEVVTKKQLQIEVIAIDADASDHSGIFDVAQEINAVMPEWVGAMESHRATIKQSSAIHSVYKPRLDELRSQNASAQLRLALLQRWAKDVLPLAQRYKTQAMVYDRIRLELGPKVESAFSLLEKHPEDADILDPFWSALKEAQVGMKDWHDVRLQGRPTLAVYWENYQHLSQLARQVALTFQQAGVRVAECNEAVERWIARYYEIEGLRQRTDLQMDNFG